MSTEAMKLALEAIQDLRGYRPDIDKAIDAIRTAIQQAEAQQPATPERVPMTDEEIGYWYSRTPSNFVFSHFKAAIRSAEAHHGITTTPQPSNA